MQPTTALPTSADPHPNSVGNLSAVHNMHLASGSSASTANTSFAARYETTSQLPPTAQQQWMYGGFMSACHGAAAASARDGASPASSCTSLHRRTPTAVLMPATLVTSGPVPVASGAPAATTVPHSLDTLFPLSPTPVSLGATQQQPHDAPLTLASPSPESSRSASSAHEGSLKGPHGPSVVTSTLLAVAMGPSGGAAIAWPSPTGSPVPATHFSAHPHGAPLTLSAEDLIFSPITTSTFASNNPSHYSSSGGGGQEGTALSGQSRSPSTPMAGGVTAMSVGVVPAASTWGDLSMGTTGSSGSVLLTGSTPSPAPHAAPVAAGGGALSVSATTAESLPPSLLLLSAGGHGGGGGLMGPPPVATRTVSRPTTTTLKAEAEEGKGSPPLARTTVDNGDMDDDSGLKETQWSDKRLQSLATRQQQQQQSLATFALPAPLDVPVGESVLSAGRRRGDESMAASHSDPSCRLDLHPAGEGADGGHSHSKQSDSQLEVTSTTVHTTTADASTSHGLPPAPATASLPPSSAQIVFLSMDLGPSGKVTPPLHQAVHTPQPPPQQPQQPQALAQWWGDAVSSTGPPPPSITATVTANAATTPTSRTNSSGCTPLTHSSISHRPPTTTANAARTGPFPGPSAAAPLWALPSQSPQRTPTPPLMPVMCIAAAGGVGGGGAAVGSTSAPPPHPVHPQPTAYLPRAVGPTQTRVPCTPVLAGMHAECSICLRSTDEGEEEDPVAPDDEPTPLTPPSAIHESRSDHSPQRELGGTRARARLTATVTAVTTPLTEPARAESSFATRSTPPSRGVKTGSPMVRLASCGHCFHSNCLQRWLLQDGSCPMCRRGVADAPTPAAAAANAASAMANTSPGSGASLSWRSATPCTPVAGARP